VAQALIRERLFTKLFEGQLDETDFAKFIRIQPAGP
jgi:hypothetical protein